MSNVKSNAPRVFVTQEMDRLNYLPAEKFGEITFLARNDFSPVRTSLSNAELVNMIKTKLRDFNPDVDAIVCSGSPTVAAAVFAFLGSKTDYFTVLRWSNRDSMYSPVVIDIKDKV